MRQIEVLAPAGSVEAMKAAYKAGADAVYIGGSMFGARAYADNADANELLGAIDYAHLHHKKLYLTVNTLLKNQEIEKQLTQYLKSYYECGLDAVIVQDLGVLKHIRTHFPDLPVHASTQMTVFSPEYGKMLKSLGVARIVTPRELNLREIKAIKQATDLEIETFVHGALCYCYSGQCLMSSMIGGRSGNRGRCAQPCRLPYTFENSSGRKSGYLLSPKDICGLDMLPDLIDAGADSLKIEGRMKKPEYAALTASVYRKYVDLYLESGKQNYRIDPEDRKMLLDLYNRGGFTGGYFKMHNGPEMMTMDRPNHTGLQIGTIAQSKKGQLNITLTEDLHKGDVIELPDQSSVKINEEKKSGRELVLRYNGKASFKTPVFRTRNELLINRVNQNYVKNHLIKEKIYGFVSISKDLPAKMILNDGEICVSATGECAAPAVSHALTAEDVKKRMMKTGQTSFEFDTLEVEVEDGCFMSIQALNQLRRDAIEKLEHKILEEYSRSYCDVQNESFVEGCMPVDEKDGISYSVLVSDISQLKIATQFSRVERIYMNEEGDPEKIALASKLTKSSGKAFYLAMPYVIRENTWKSISKVLSSLDMDMIDGFLVRNLDAALWLGEHYPDKPLIADYNVYTMNDTAASMVRAFTQEITLPLELNKQELEKLKCPGKREMIVYGYMPVMISAQCLTKNTGRCTHKPEMGYLKDRMNMTFKVKNICHHCYNIIYNSVPLYLGDLNAYPAGSLRIQFLDEGADTVNKLLREITGSNDSGKNKDAKMYTKGHYKRGVE